MTPVASRLYFAYGSNLHPVRLADRVSSAELLGAAVLHGHLLRFHKRGRDGSAKCDALHTGRAADYVLGAVFRVSEAAVARLDALEGPGYQAATVAVSMAGTPTRALTYRADPDWVDPRLRPFDWYKALVLAGARFHDLPPAWVDGIRAVASEPDPDQERAAAHAALLGRMAEGPRP